jgi:hypothetical protein
MNTIQRAVHMMDCEDNVKRAVTTWAELIPTTHTSSSPSGPRATSGVRAATAAGTASGSTPRRRPVRHRSSTTSQSV